MKNRVDSIIFGYRICSVVREQSTCVRRKVACVVFHGKRNIATGYNGVKSGEPHPIKAEDCFRNNLSILPGCQSAKTCCVHAEQNAADLVKNTPWAGKRLWAVSWTEPCVSCSKSLYNVGVDIVFYHEPYPETHPEERPEGLKLVHLPYKELSENA